MTADLAQPHTARVVDYWLGGSHHYSVDRAAAKEAEKALPDLADFQQAHRVFLRRAYSYLIMAQGLDKFVDFGSGLPTQGNVHEVTLGLDPDAKIIYSDNDPEVVRYGQEILSATCPESAQYVYCEAGHPEELLEAEIPRTFLAGERRVGIGFSNLPHLVADSDLKWAFETVYDWAAPGSHMVVSWVTDGIHDYPDILKIQQRHGRKRFYRTNAEMLDLLGPWTATEHGITHSDSWPKQRTPTTPMKYIHHAAIVQKP